MAEVASSIQTGGSPSPLLFWIFRTNWMVCVLLLFVTATYYYFRRPRGLPPGPHGRLGLHRDFASDLKGERQNCVFRNSYYGLHSFFGT